MTYPSHLIKIAVLGFRRLYFIRCTGLAEVTLIKVNLTYFFPGPVIIVVIVLNGVYYLLINL